MDPASLVVGGVGVALQLHQLVLGCLEALRNFRDAGEVNALLNCKLQIEQCILAKWGQRCELAQGRLGRHLPHKEDREMVVMILKNMLGLVAEAETLKKRYGMKHVTSEERNTTVTDQKMIVALLSFPKKELPPQISGPDIAMSRMDIAADNSSASSSPDEAVAHQKWIEKGKTNMSFIKKYRWVVVDSRRFEEMIRHLRDFNKSLYRLTQESVPALVLEGDILDATPDRHLDTVEQATTELYPAVSLVMNIRRSVAHFESTGLPDRALGTIGPYRNLRIDLDQLHFRKIPGSTRQTRTMAAYRPSHGRSKPVLVEWRRFESGLTQTTRDATIRRAENLARILQKKPKQESAANFRLLECAGFYITDQEVGFVFDLPPGTNASHSPQSLEELLCDEESDSDMDGPPLGQRLALCKALCNSIYWLHASDLVHKAIRSCNVLFFEREDEGTIRLEEPYVTGFDHSRPDGPNDPTITITTISEDEDRYRHPAARLSTSRRSTKIHDMYSLGLVLLEIAHWIKLKDLVQNKVGKEVLNHLMSDESPVNGMAYLVGSRLQRIVERCVRCDFSVDIGDPDSSAILRDIFLHEIAAEIMKCSV